LFYFEGKGGKGKGRVEAFQFTFLATSLTVLLQRNVDVWSLRVKVDRPCHRYATIIEPVVGVGAAKSSDDHLERSSAVCGRRARRQHVYTSTSHVVHIRLESYRVNPDYFVLSYEGNDNDNDNDNDNFIKKALHTLHTVRAGSLLFFHSLPS